MKKDTPSSNKPFERGLYLSLAEGLSMNTAFTNFLEIVIISVLNINPAIQGSDRWKEREEKYKRLLDTRKDKTIPVTMLSDLVQLMQEHHEEKKEKKSEYKFRIIKLKTLVGDVYEVQVFRKFLRRERRTDVKTFDYEDEAEKLIECLQSYRNPEVVKEFKVKL